MKKIVGIDIAKLTFEVNYIDANGQCHSVSYANTAKGHQEFLLSVGVGYIFVMEATGAYYYLLASYLYEQGAEVCVLNPLVAKRYCQMRFQRNKTDKADALALREFGQTQELNYWKPLSSNDMKIRHLYSNVKRLVKNRTALINQLHAFKTSGNLANDLAKMMEEELSQIKKYIASLETQLEKLVEQSYPDLFGRVQTIPGIGPKSALLLLVVCRGFQNFTNAKQVIAYIGTSPRVFQSGTSVNGKSKICKLGMSSVRQTLYVAANSAIKYNATCKALYERLREKGKPYRVAMIAVVNKLVKQVFAIAKSGIPYQQGHQPILN